MLLQYVQCNVLVCIFLPYIQWFLVNTLQQVQIVTKLCTNNFFLTADKIINKKILLSFIKVTNIFILYMFEAPKVEK